MGPVEEAFPAPNLSGNSSFQQAKSPRARREERPREHGMGLPPAWGCHLHPLPILGESSTLGHVGLNIRVPKLQLTTVTASFRRDSPNTMMKRVSLTWTSSKTARTATGSTAEIRLPKSRKSISPASTPGSVRTEGPGSGKPATPESLSPDGNKPVPHLIPVTWLQYLNWECSGMSPKEFPDLQGASGKAGLRAFLLQHERSMRDVPVGTQVHHCSSSKYHQRQLSSPTSGPGIKWFLRAQESSKHSPGQPGPVAPAKDREHGNEPAMLAKVGRQK